MNTFKLSRRFWDYAFENPDKVRPVHCALYFFIIEHSNRMGWKDKVGLPTTMAMDAIGVKNYRTYGVALQCLIDWDFIKLHEKSKNQYSSNVVALVQNTEASTEPTTSPLTKAMSQQTTKQVQSIASIDKPITKEPNNQERLNVSVYPFIDFWELYDKKVSKDKAEKLWANLSETDQKEILDYIPKYKIAQPEKKYRKSPDTFLRNKSWQDELIESEQKGLFGSPQVTQPQSRPTDVF